MFALGSAHFVGCQTLAYDMYALSTELISDNHKGTRVQLTLVV